MSNDFMNHKCQTNLFSIGILIAVMCLSTAHSKGFDEQFIMLKPVSWDELQLLSLDEMRLSEDFNLSKVCPKELSQFEQLERLNTHFKEIFWSQYYWTTFENSDGSICVVKHEDIGFFSHKKQGSAAVVSNYEILTEDQTKILLNAVKLLSLNDEALSALKRHIHFHNQAVQEAPFMKYGGSVKMTQFMMNNPRETMNYPGDDEGRKFVDANGIEAYRTLGFLQVFESKYKTATLERLKRDVAEENRLTTEVRRYPFDSFSDLLNEVLKDKSQ